MSHVIISMFLAVSSATLARYDMFLPRTQDWEPMSELVTEQSR